MNTLKNNRHWKERALLMAVADVITVMGSYFLALLLRFDFTFSAIEVRFIDGFVKLIGPWCAVTLVVFYFCHLYHSIWSLASTTELISVIMPRTPLMAMFLTRMRSCKEKCNPTPNINSITPSSDS